MKPKQTESKELLPWNGWFSVQCDTLVWPSGFVQPMNLVVSKDFAVVVAVRDDHVLTVEQYRHTMERRSIEFPMGAMEDGETPRKAAHREFLEETGHRAERMIPLGSFFPANGRMRAQGHVFLADDIREDGPARRERSEQDMTMSWMPISRLEFLMNIDEIECAATLVAWDRYRRYPKK